MQDRRGAEFPNEARARLEAQRILGRIGAEEPWLGNELVLTVTVRDGMGRPVHRMALTLRNTPLTNSSH
jgi:hypothetical protein